MRRVAPSLRWLLGLALAPALCLMVCGSARARADGASGIVRDAGVQLRWNYERNSDHANDGLGQLTFEISDEASGNPLRYAPGQLAVWLQRQLSLQGHSAECESFTMLSCACANPAWRKATGEYLAAVVGHGRSARLEVELK